MTHVRLFCIGKFMRMPAFALALALTLFLTSFSYASSSSGGTLTIITVPERAEVWIDGNYAGLTPIRDKRLAEGTYILRLVDPSRQNSTSETVVISDGERLIVERSLAGSYGRFRVDTDPQGASVAIVAELGITPLVNDYLTPGQYRIEIRHPDAKYLPITQDVTFAAGQPVAISQKLEMHEKPPVFTKKRLVQLALGTGAALCWTWAVIEQNTASTSRQESIHLPDDEADEKLTQSKNAGIRRTIAVAAAAALSVALQVTIFIW